MVASESCGCCHRGGSPESNTPLSVDRLVYTFGTTNLGPQDAFCLSFFNKKMNHLDPSWNDGIAVGTDAESLLLSNDVKQMNVTYAVVSPQRWQFLKVQEYLDASNSADLPIGQWLHGCVSTTANFGFWGSAVPAMWTPYHMVDRMCTVQLELQQLSQLIIFAYYFFKNWIIMI